MAADTPQTRSKDFERDAPRILVVEDDEQYRQPLRRVLDRAGYRVDEAASVREAMEQIGNVGAAALDLVLVDYYLPDGLGLDVLEALQDAADEVRALVLTSQPSKALRERTLAAGAAGFVGKPASVAEVLDLVADAIG